jgi:PilZ domain
VRSSGRIPKQIPILLIGSDLDGRVFSEPTTTVLLSLHGAGIVSKHKLSPEQELVLRWTDKNKESEIRVVGHLGSQNSQHTYGVAFFDPNINFWEIDFPPISALEMELGLISLVCSSCNTLEKIDDTSIEADVCATNEGVLRSCKRCGTTTLWKPVSSVMNQASVSLESAQLPLFSAPATLASAQIPAPSSNSAPAPAASPGTPSAAPPSFYAQPHSSSPDSATSPSTVYAARPGLVGEPCAAVLTMAPPLPENPAFPRANRRKHPRVKVNYSACIRHPERGDDIVACEDMSKGGLRFKSRTKYYAQSLIDVAVPYQPGQPAIFVPAQIVFVEELPEQRLFRCGVQYLRPTKPRDYF